MLVNKLVSAVKQTNDNLNRPGRGGHNSNQAILLVQFGDATSLLQDNSALRNLGFRIATTGARGNPDWTLGKDLDSEIAAIDIETLRCLYSIRTVLRKLQLSSERFRNTRHPDKIH